MIVMLNTSSTPYTFTTVKEPSEKLFNSIDQWGFKVLIGEADVHVELLEKENHRIFGVAPTRELAEQGILEYFVSTLIPNAGYTVAEAYTACALIIRDY